MLRDTIQELDESTAVQVLMAFAKDQKRPGKPAPEWDSGMAPAISEALGVSSSFGVEAYDEYDEHFEVSRGAVARHALLALIEDAAHAPAVKVMANNAQPQGFDIVEGTALISALLVALQTQLELALGEDGRWTASLRDPELDTTALKAFAGKFLAFLDQ